MSQSYGFVETQGLIGSIEAADAMLKAARVTLVQKREIGFGLVTVIVEGELGAVQSAVDAGKAAAERLGQFLTCHVIARPFKDTDLLIMQRLGVSPEADTPVPAIQKEEVVKAPEKKESKPRKKRQKKTTVPENDDARILSMLRSGKKGATLEEIATQIKQDVSQTRILLKRLIDQQKIEKVQQRYYLL